MKFTKEHQLLAKRATIDAIRLVDSLHSIQDMEHIESLVGMMVSIQRRLNSLASTVVQIDFILKPLEERRELPVPNVPEEVL